MPETPKNSTFGEKWPKSVIKSVIKWEFMTLLCHFYATFHQMWNFGGVMSSPQKCGVWLINIGQKALSWRHEIRKLITYQPPWDWRNRSATSILCQSSSVSLFLVLSNSPCAHCSRQASTSQMAPWLSLSLHKYT